MFLLLGLPAQLSTKALIDRGEIGTKSLQLVKLRQEYAHEPILNPYSSEFAQQPSAPAPPAKTVLVPKYVAWMISSILSEGRTLTEEFAGDDSVGPVLQRWLFSSWRPSDRHRSHT